MKDRIAGRFELLREIGAGGMGTVFCARDHESGADVAIKVMHDRTPELVHRFERESQVLAELEHPAIVRHVAHGVSDGRPWLAMEWLEGEDLAARLARGPMTIDETLVLLRRVSDALAVVHVHGVVHRDVKPSNVHVGRGDPSDAKLLDFGIARVASARAKTATGVALGTIGYMAPEQARGEVAVMPSADVFALGCVAFECLTGKPAFQAADAVGVLAKILLEEAPRLRSLLPSAPAALDDLVRRMLSKDPAARPADGRALRAELDRLAGAVASMSPARPSITASEQRVVSVVMAREPRTEVEPDAPTLAASEHGPLFARAASALEPFHARVDMLADGTLLVALSDHAVPTDRAAQAARCAIALRRVIAHGPIVVATGRALVGQSALLGDAIDRAAALLRRSSPAILVDDVTAGLLGSRFDVRAGELAGEIATSPATRTLLGKRVPFVGRQRELATLVGLFEESASEPAARAALVTGVAGMGKSRLLQEWIAALESRGSPAKVLIGRGDPMRVGAPFGMIAAALRHADIDDVAPEFLAELAGVPVRSPSAALLAARENPELLADRLQQAWEDFLVAECRAQPVCVVLEDLHWGDRPTIDLVDTSLRRLRDERLFVLALARPEIDDAFPRLWADRDLQTIRLGGLTKRAAESLVSEVLGPDALDRDAMDRLVGRAEGNAFYLEELIRALAEGRGELPGTVLAMVQARLERLDEEERRVLRAASVFGETFSRTGVEALVGEHATDVGATLVSLAAREIVRPAQDHEHAFRHALVRDAAYAMLTDTDRELGHRIAGAWLESRGEPDAIVLARHFELGGDRRRAALAYLDAAKQTLEGSDRDAVLDRVARGLSCDPPDEVRGLLWLARSDASSYKGALADAEESAITAIPLLEPGSAPWCRAHQRVVHAARMLGHRDHMLAFARALHDRLCDAELDEAKVIAWADAARSLNLAGARTEASVLLDRLEAVLESFPIDGPSAAAAMHEARASVLQQSRDYAGTVREREKALAYLASIGDRRGVARLKGFIGYPLMRMGSPRAVAYLREAIAESDEVGLAEVAAVARHNLGMALARTGALDEALAVEEELAGTHGAGIHPLFEAFSRAYLAEIHMLRNDLERAEKEAVLAVEAARDLPPIIPFMHATLARVLLCTGRAKEAHALMAPLESSFDALYSDEGEELVRLAHAESLEGIGEHAAARVAIARARDRLLERAGKISDDELRASFLDIAENRRTLELAAAWLPKA